MRGLILFAVTLATTSVAYAQSGTVRKVKGKSAIIRFDERPDFRKGERVSVGEGSSSSSSMGGGWNRDYSLSLVASLESTSVKVGSVESDADSINLQTIFMFNKRKFEFGGGFLYNSTDTGASDTTEYSFVGVGEYNIIENKPGTKFVPAIQGLFGISNYEAGSASGNGFRYGFGGRLKMFPWNDSFAIVAAFGIASSTIDVGGGTEIETEVTGLSAGIQGYF